MVNFVELIEAVLQETTVMGGDGSAYGSGVSSTATPFSGPNYAGNDSRTPTSLYGGIVTRKGMKRKNKRKSKRK
jgi:hypothetical protein